MTTNVIIQQPLGQSQMSDWSTGICDCCDDMSICCLGFWCYPCLTCKAASDFGECLCLPLLDFLCPSYLPPISIAMRAAVRNRYGIQGSVCTDCFCATFCRVCSWCQVSREIKRRKQTLTIINPQPMVFATTSPIPTATTPFIPVVTTVAPRPIF